MTTKQYIEYNSLIKSFIEDYNAKTEEINDEFGGIFDEDLEDVEQITKWFDADRSIVAQERNLMEMWNDLVKLADMECIISTYVLYDETLLVD